MSNPSTLSPVEIDTKLAELYAEETRQRTIRDRQQDYYCGDQRYRSYFDATVFKKAEAALKAVIEQQRPYEAEYERRPWSRFWHVTNSNGHIHNSQGCTSCFPDTQYAWRTDLSGLSESEVVAREAHNACSVCMPIAPAEQKAARERYTREQQQARKAERQAKKDEKAAKALARAEKHVEKVLKAMRDMTGEHNGEVFEVVHVFARDWSVYGHDGKKSIYKYSYDLPLQVGDTLYYLGERNEGKERSIHQPNEAVMTALRNKEII